MRQEFSKFNIVNIVGMIAIVGIVAMYFAYSQNSLGSPGPVTGRVTTELAAGQLTGNAVSSTSATCTDSDGGYNLALYGEIQAGKAWAVDACFVKTSTSYSRTGSCSGDTCYLLENQCNTDSTTSTKPYSSKYVPCPTGCVKGACKGATQTTTTSEQTAVSSTATVTCVDSDGGQVIEIPGKASDAKTTVSDVCKLKKSWFKYISRNVDTTSCSGDNCYIKEAICASRFGGTLKPTWKTIPCPDGCKDAACAAYAPIPLPKCGDGVVESGEECEFNSQCNDNHAETTDTCQTCHCQFTPIIVEPVCGNGKVESGEQCEYSSQCNDNNAGTTDACQACQCKYTAITPVCGNGQVESGEQCESNSQCNDNNAGTTDTCQTCQCKYTAITPTCGNGLVESGEQCDGSATPCNDNNAGTTDTCTSCACIHTPTDTTSPTISSVSASGVLANSATVTWATNEASTSQVEFGTTTGYGSITTLNTALVTTHSIGLSGLTANTLYHYRVKSKDAAGNLATSGDFTFTTPASTTTPPPTSTSLEGYGNIAVGGTGGDTYHVTNLNDNGAGSLRNGIVNRAGPRKIVFDVGGTITLASDLVIAMPYLTIDGSTAPSPGITLQLSGARSIVIAGTHDIVLTHMRIDNPYSFAIDGDSNPDHIAQRIVLDHMTFKGAVDGAPDIWGDVRDLTISWSIMYSGDKGNTISFYPEPYYARQRVSIHHNIYAKNYERNPQFRADNRDVDFVNNIIYGWGLYGTRIRNDYPPKTQINIINNAFLPGSGSPRSAALVYGSEVGPSDSEESRGMGGIWLSGNTLPTENVDDYSTLSSPWNVPSTARVTTWGVSELSAKLLPGVGMKYRNSAEASLINEIASALGGTPVPTAVCGNSIVETGEQCDGSATPCNDNNAGTTDACTSCACTHTPITTQPVCGNSIVETGEQCDGSATPCNDNNAATTDTCQTCQCQNTATTTPPPTTGNWVAPIGIPAPTFGINEIAPTYNQANSLHFYVNNAVACSDTNNGGHGSPTAPRCTIPQSLSAGSYVEVRGGPYIYNTDGQVSHQMSGTAASPVFIKGVGSPLFTHPSTVEGDRTLILGGSYYIVDGIKVVAKWMTVALTGNHGVLRNSDLSGHTADFGSKVSAGGSYHVVYNNYIHDNGPVPTTTEYDMHGFKCSSGCSYIWILDNRIERNSGDDVQIGDDFISNNPANWPHHIYIGRNKGMTGGENCIDIKQATDVVISQNTCSDFTPGGTSDGTAIVLHNSNQRTWVLFNEVYNSFTAIRTNANQADDGAAGSSQYIIGNLIHDVRYDGFDPGDSYQSAIVGWNNQQVTIVDNTLVNVNRCIALNSMSTAITMSGNLCSTTGTNLVWLNTVSGTESLDYTLFAPTTSVGWLGSERLSLSGIKNLGQCANCKEGSALLDASYVPQSGSPAIDANKKHAAYDTFQSLYGINIAVDKTGKPRPTTGWDIGAFER